VASSAETLRCNDVAALLAEAQRVERDRERRLRAMPVEPGAGAGRSPESSLVEVLEDYADEIAGRFDPRVYRAVIAAGRFGFNWLSHAAGGRGLSPFRLDDLLPSRIAFTGEVAQLLRLVGHGTVLLVPTHQSHNDILLFGHVLDRLRLPPFAWGAGLNLFANPLLGFVLRRAGAYTIDRNNSCTIYRTALRNYSAKLIEAGVHSLFFPGGGRSRSGAIEPGVRLGLLHSGLQAQRAMLRAGHARPHVYVVPVTVSYHSVLEAPWLIDEYLSRQGVASRPRSSRPIWAEAARFHWCSFAREDSATVRFGAALDMQGQPVAAETVGADHAIDPAERLASLERAGSSHELIEQLGQRIVESFYANATILASQATAYALFEAIRADHPGLGLQQLMNLPDRECSVSIPRLHGVASELTTTLRTRARAGQFHLDSVLAASPPEDWLRRGLERLADFHGPALVSAGADWVASRDLRLLYYYRNRLTGHGLERPSPQAEPARRGQLDDRGFLE